MHMQAGCSGSPIIMDNKYNIGQNNKQTIEVHINQQKLQWIE